MKVFVLLLLFNAMLSSGCAIPKPYYAPSSTERSEPLYFSQKHYQDQSAWQVYQAQEKTERDKIRYLIMQVSDSDYRFLRNGNIYESPIAARWLRHKLQKYNAEAQSARDFIDRVGSYSRTSGDAYYILVDEREIVPVKQIMHNEIDRLESLL